MTETKAPQPTGEHVDTWEMVLVHKLFRREFRQMPELVRGVAAGDTARSEIVSEHIAFVTMALHHHHTGEDDLLWPPLLKRVGTMDDELVLRMEKQHEVVAVLLEQMEKLLPVWRAKADVATRDELARTLVEVSAALDEHLGDEENEVLPLVSVYVTQAEWDAVGDRGKSAIPKGAKGFEAIGMILQDATERERELFLGLLPAPVRLIHRVVGAGIHRRAKARLHPVS